MNMKDFSLSVSEVNRYVKSLIESDACLSEITVRGEISNLKYHSSGHIYFTLKDEESEIAAVMFRAQAQRMTFRADNGMKVTAYGRVSVYEKSGRYQLYVSAMTDDGAGALYLEYKRLYEKLRAEGLFDESRKKLIPKIPKKIGIVTSPTGAAVRDMLNITGRRWPAAEILIYPSLVQGADAPRTLCQGVEYLNADGTCDVIIIGRGGGSVEDLWAFNDETLARTVAASHIPVISAVGHEVDFTLCDFAADKRAPTPSAAAEIAVPDRADMIERFDEAMERIDICASRLLERKGAMLRNRAQVLEMRSPKARLERIRQKLSYDSSRIEKAADRVLERSRARLYALSQSLSAMNPLAVLGRGYSALEKDGKIIGKAAELEVHDRVSILLSDGRADAEILSVDKKEII
ncbi:MAG: exodeoxyribonuclease VII large subunit [Ruminococcaceae bacterium]|nr:exodeoxyribonuclease VII large subunit [Oscillospiraceae bacterium]